ncbi:putative Glycosyl hydrolase [Nitrospira moscoviensis]|uniref:Putative Glycosyl hydrolase n=2 Tax=Nitrospira moscoviensis TaxID=42253 RepID=A0A0K2GE84_NITMO|nr:putative Glycosyl hydrolase [Nitrospira moscoviensis]
MRRRIRISLMTTTWYSNALFYAVDVPAFQDSNGDGIGDFRGLIGRLPYLADLGVTCLWLLPFYPSPGRDNGYDVSNYYEIHPDVGSLDDFTECVHRAGELGMRILLDLVIDHTSDRHPWFQAARRDRQSRYRAYYIWADAPSPPEPDHGPIFPDTEPTVWTHDEVAGQYFYHRFYRFEPDLNAFNPEVREEFLRIIDFWLSFGVAGFRIDAASHLIEGPGSQDDHGILKELRTYADRRRPGTALLGESDVEPDRLAAYFGAGDELHLLYNFYLDNYLFLALAEERADPLVHALGKLPAIPESCRWVNFLRNLDELDLERLGEPEREAVYRAFAPDDEMRIFGRGIRRRLAPMLNDRRKREMALSLLFTLPGVPLVVYGDEIGMGEDLSLPGRHAVRTAMQWAPSPNGGFSDAPKERLRRPLLTDGPFGYERVNITDQQADPGSFLNWMKRLIAARRDCPLWGSGSHRIIDAGGPAVLAHECAGHGDRLIALHNLTGKDQPVSLPAFQTDTFVPIFHSAGDAREDAHPPRELEPYGYRWYRLAG